MTSNPPSNPLPIPSNPVPSNPLIPPGDWNTPLGLEPSGVFSGRNGVLGIDPGFGGALAWLDFGGALRVEDLPVLTIERKGKAMAEPKLRCLRGTDSPSSQTAPHSRGNRGRNRKGAIFEPAMPFCPRRFLARLNPIVGWRTNYPLKGKQHDVSQ